MNHDSNLGTVERHDDTVVLRYERHLDHPVERVWAAITEPDELVAWLGKVEIDPRTGGRIVIEWLNTDEAGNHAVLHGNITHWDPPALLELVGDIHGTLRWELTRAGSGCRLVFSSTVALPDEYLLSVLAGWHVHLDFLADALDGIAVDWPNWPYDRWQAVHERYAAELAQSKQ